MSDAEVLEMPSYRFWSMSNQIDRIRAERDLRELNIHRGASSSDELKEVMNRLTIELGDRCKIQHSQIVKAEPNAKNKFLSVMG